MKIAQTHARIKEKLSELPDIYERAYNASAWQVGRESVGKISRGGVSKPLEGIVGDPLDKRRPGRQAAIRRRLEEAETHLARAESAIEDIERDINKAMNRLDPPETFELLRNPRSASDADLEEAREAQARRRQRGEIE